MLQETADFVQKVSLSGDLVKLCFPQVSPQFVREACHKLYLRPNENTDSDCCAKSQKDHGIEIHRPGIAGESHGSHIRRDRFCIRYSRVIFIAALFHGGFIRRMDCRSRHRNDNLYNDYVCGHRLCSGTSRSGALQLDSRKDRRNPDKAAIVSVFVFPFPNL